MKSRTSTEKAVPVPGRGTAYEKGSAKKHVKTMVMSILLLVLAIGSVYVGIKLAPHTDIPVALANGEVITPPYYITVDGKRTVLVESKEAAEETVQKVIEEYEGDPDEVIDIHVEEVTGAEKMKIKTGDDPPEVLSVEQAKEHIQLTVVITKEETDIAAIDYEEKYSPDPNMYIGETEIQIEGEKGIKEVITKTVSENGEIIETEIIEENIIKEPETQIVLKGTKSHDGYGGGEGTIDVGVSYDEEAAYDILKTPVPSVYISSPFGPRWGRFHSGVDFALAQGLPIYAADSGRVYYSGYSGGYGKLVKIDHGNGMQTYYAHCSSLNVSEGQQVKEGEIIAAVGSTGNSTGPHLHFEVIINGNRVDPMDFLELKR